DYTAIPVRTCSRVHQSSHYLALSWLWCRTVRTSAPLLSASVKFQLYLRAITGFAAMNEVYATFVAAPFPARTTIQAGALPGGIAVEIECIARKIGPKKSPSKNTRSKKVG